MIQRSAYGKSQISKLLALITKVSLIQSSILMRAAKQKIAVIGTGPAGMGVLSGLMEQGNKLDISVFEIDKTIPTKPFDVEVSDENIKAYYDEIYYEIRTRYPFKFPPPKTQFAETLPKYPIEGKEKIFRSETLGGLSNFWGGGSLPFTEVEFEKWPIDFKDIEPYYQKLSEVIGITGQPDGLNKYFKKDFVCRPPMKMTSITKKLDATVNNETNNTKYSLISGVCRTALEVRDSHDGKCRECGECLAGCFAGSIYSTRKTINCYLKEKHVNLVKGQVRSINPEDKTITVKINDDTESFGGFSKIYLAAGCPNTTTIVMRSLGLKKTENIADNAVYVFPILYFGKVGTESRNEPYLSLCTLIWGLVPEAEGLKFAQGSIYTNFDYMWRYNVPPALWPVFKGLVSYSRARLFWVRLYTHGDDSQAYSISLENDEPVFNYARRADRTIIPDMMKSIRKAVNRNGFYIPPIPPLLQKSNSHYASSLPYGGELVGMNKYGEVMPDVFICDSSVFPDLPAVSLTFTIMANGFRTAAETIIG